MAISTINSSGLNQAGDTVFCTTSGNVGIGTSSPSKKLDVRGASGAIHLESTTGTNAAFLEITNTGGTYYFGVENSAGTSFGCAPYAQIDWVASGRSRQVYMEGRGVVQTIDSSGRVAMPYQPAFFAYPSGNISGTGQAVFGLTRFNRGSNYSTSTGRFTAPVAGVYFFTAQGLPLSTVNYPFMRIWKNGSGYSADTYVVNADESVSISCAVEMAANDYVTVYYIDGSEGGYSHFSGFFIG